MVGKKKSTLFIIQYNLEFILKAFMGFTYMVFFYVLIQISVFLVAVKKIFDAFDLNLKKVAYIFILLNCLFT